MQAHVYANPFKENEKTPLNKNACTYTSNINNSSNNNKKQKNNNDNTMHVKKTKSS